MRKNTAAPKVSFQERLKHYQKPYKNIILMDKFPDSYKSRAKWGLVYYIMLISLIVYVKLFEHPYFMIFFIFGTLIPLYLYLFYDKTLSLQTHSLGKGIYIKKRTINQLKTYLVYLDLLHNKNNGIIEENVMKNGQENTLKQHNALLVRNLANNKVNLTMGWQLKGIALHVKPNYPDFLRRLQALQSFIPVCVQIDVNRNTETSQVEFSYNMFITLTKKNLKTKEYGELFTKMRQNYHQFTAAKTQNFPHFNFQALEEEELIKAIYGTQIPPQFKIDKISNGTQWYFFNNATKFVLFLFSQMAVLFIIIYFYPITKEQFTQLNTQLGITFSLGLIYSGNLFSKFYRSHLNYGENIIEIQIPSDGFYAQSSLFASNSEKLFVNPKKEKVQLYKYYTMGDFNKYFNFNGTKLYRDIMNIVQRTHATISVQFYFSRIISGEMHRYKGIFGEIAWKYWLSNLKNHSSILRKYCGFYRVQPLICVGYCSDQEIRKINYKKIQIQAQQMEEYVLPILQSSFPQCDIMESSEPLDVQYLFKSSLLSTLGLKIPLHFIHGVRLASFIEIPDEIHRSLPSYYPIEFSAPFLADELIFGKVFNAENFSLENQAGITYKELHNNVLFTGEFDDIINANFNEFAKCLIKSHIPSIFFDWDGSMASMVRDVRSCSYSSMIDILVPGENFGLMIFELPDHIRGGHYEPYIENICNLFTQIFDIDSKHLSILKAIINEKADSVSIMEFKEILNSLVACYEEKNDLLKFSNVILTQLNLLNKGNLKNIFDNILGCSDLLPRTFLNPERTVIIDLSNIINADFKVLFVRTLLLQLLHTLDIRGIRTIKNHKTMYLPKLSKIDCKNPRIKYALSHLFSIDELINRGYWLIGQTTNITEVTPELLNKFDTIYAFRTKEYNAQKIVSSLLKLDQNFTNTFTHSQRHISYQKEFLQELNDNQSIVVRKTQSKPYVFEFEQTSKLSTDTGGELSGYSGPEFSIFKHDYSKNFPELLITRESEDFVLDLGTYSIYEEEIGQFFQEMNEMIEITKIVPFHEVEQTLRSYLEKSFAPGTNQYFRQKTVKNIIQQLLERDYLRETTITTTAKGQDPSSINESSGYVLGKKAIQFLVKLNRRSLMNNNGKEEKITNLDLGKEITGKNDTLTNDLKECKLRKEREDSFESNEIEAREQREFIHEFEEFSDIGEKNASIDEENIKGIINRSIPTLVMDAMSNIHEGKWYKVKENLIAGIDSLLNIPSSKELFSDEQTQLQEFRTLVSSAKNSSDMKSVINSLSQYVIYNI